ncbi:protease inhibitor I42 family protein [Methanosarcina barkeri]|uniref:protease inhibitor I42 family protein n=1 Tax=Methanosarcina barkeri TaxID=2208 RepID=UPI00069704EF|nr:protease inhibitor I42 family protein [Methanosarcina barkeri]
MSKFIHGMIVLITCLALATLPTAVCAKHDIVSQNKIITENDNGNTIYIKEGNAFFLILKENPSTGYSWQLRLSSGLNQLSDKYQPFESPKNNFVIGAGGLRLWKIEGVAKGNQQVNAIYKRPWESTGKEQTFKLNVVVI